MYALSIAAVLVFSFSQQIAFAQSPKTTDGREFSKLAEAEVDALSDTEYDKYQKWKIAQKAAANNQKQETGKQLDTANNQKQETNNQLINELLTDFDGKMQTFQNLQKLYEI